MDELKFKNATFDSWQNENETFFFVAMGKCLRETRFTQVKTVWKMRECCTTIENFKFIQNIIY